MMHTSATSSRFSWNSADALTAAGVPLLFGVRLWASVCLALFVAFWLELDNPFWAGSSAAIVCLPQLGASLRKGWFRMIGTVIGATMIVVLTACFPQDRIAFLGLLALWGGICAFAATLLGNFASYSASLAGYTAAIIAADMLGATGGASSEVFLLAVWRASEICIGIACAGIVLAGTDLGGAQRRLATTFASLAAEIAGRFTGMLARGGAQAQDTQTERGEFLRRVIALDPMIDQALGESSHVRCHTPTLQTAVRGLFSALAGWSAVAMHLKRLPDNVDRRATKTILSNIPPGMRSTSNLRTAAGLMTDPIAQRQTCDEAVQKLLALPAGTPSQRLLADETAKVLTGIAQALDGLALLVDAPGQLPTGHGSFRLSVPDWLPAFVNAARAFVAIVAIELFWLATAWPDGAAAIVLVAIMLLLLSPRGDLAFGGAIAFGLGAASGFVCAAIIKFAVLPALQTFPAFCIAIGLFFIPVGFAIAYSRKPAVIVVCTAMAFSFNPLLAPTNPMSYDTAQFYNAGLAIVAGCGIVPPLAFSLFPPLSPTLRARRLLALSLRDLRRLAVTPLPISSEDWESRMYARLAALPGEAGALQRARLLAALSIGTEVIQLRSVASHLGVAAGLDAALDVFAQGNSAAAITRLHQLDGRLATGSEIRPDTAIALRARGRILVISEELSEHAFYFEAGAPA
jgi:uncharacterized membrane protein YccC